MSTLHNSFFASKLVSRPPSGNANPHRIRGESTGARSSTTANSRRALPPQAVSKDWKLVQQAIAGDFQAREELFATHTARLYHTAFSVLRNKEDAEDAVQNSLCRAFINLPSFQGRSSFTTWLTRIVINSALMIRRMRSGHSETSLDKSLVDPSEPLEHRIVDAGPNPEEIYAANEIRELVAERVHRLPQKLRTAYELYELHGLSAPDSLKVLGISKGGFKARVFRARQILVYSLRSTLHAQSKRQSAVESYTVTANSLPCLEKSRAHAYIRI
jgi:RNA polymerase sigma factor (sigma-70 family)